MPLTTAKSNVWRASPEFYRHMKPPFNLVDLWDRYMNPERNGGHNPSSIEGSQYFTRRGLASIRAEPFAYAWYSFKKIAYLWIGLPAADWPGHAPLRAKEWLPYFSPGYVAANFAGRLIALAGVLASWLLRHHLGRLLPLLAVCASFTAVHAALWAEVQY